MNGLQWFFYRVVTHLYPKLCGVPLGTFYNPDHVSIGVNTDIASNVVLATMTHDIYNPTVHTGVKRIHIGDNCFIGANSVILPGVVLGDNTIVGAGSVVTKSFPRGFVVIGGNPARVLKKILSIGDEGVVVP